MPRNTECEVKAIRPTDLAIKPMIDAASLIVDGLNDKFGKSFSDTTLTAIELWLAAHFVGTIDPLIVREKFENSDITKQVGNTNLSGIMSDKYGQTANALASGCLVELDKSVACVDLL